ncbi:MAG TPA: hypothetical protein DCY13_24770 [Verrucomicrobiales bacterium]|nr:hypothetical protein [Verrucomicrobiales bacterium]
MHNIPSRFIVIACLLLLSPLCTLADDLGTLAGKWTMTRKNSEGQTVIHKLQFKENKFTFRAMSEGGSTILYAEGDAKVVTTAGVKLVSLTNIKAGASDTEIESTEEVYAAPFRVSGSTCYLASGLDREREEAPRMDVYRKE